MDIQTIKKMNQITRRIEKTYNEMLKLKNYYDKKQKELNQLQNELNNLTNNNEKKE